MHKIIKVYNWFAYSFKLGYGPRGKLILLYMFLRWKLIAYVGQSLRDILPLPEVIHIVFQGRELSIHVADDNSFPFLFYEIFISEDYRVDLSQSPACILDVGAHYGLASLYYTCLYPNAVIHAFEPSSSNFRYLKMNTKDFRNVHTYQLALFSRSGTERLYLHPSSGENSLLDPAGHFEDINTTTLDEFFVGQGIGHVDILKIDVEGAEEEILTATNALDVIHYIVGEVHFGLINWPRLRKTLAKLFDLDCSIAAPGCGIFRAVNRALELEKAAGRVATPEMALTGPQSV